MAARFVNDYGLPEFVMKQAAFEADRLGLHCRIDLRPLKAQDADCPGWAGRCLGITTLMANRYVVYINVEACFWQPARALAYVLAHEFRHVWQQETGRLAYFVLYDDRPLERYGPLMSEGEGPVWMRWGEYRPLWERGVLRGAGAGVPWEVDAERWASALY